MWLLMLRGDHSLNDIKANKQPGLAGYRFATEAEIFDTFGTPPGYLGPVGTKKPIKGIGGRTVPKMSDFLGGSNEVDYYTTRVEWWRGFPETGRTGHRQRG